MNYQKIYDAIIAKARSEETIPGNYYERHHILPKCIGGGNEPENLVTLSARSHYIVHQLLVKIYPEVHGLAFATRIMTINSNGQHVNNRMYEWLRTRLSLALKARVFSPEARANMSKALMGNTRSVGRVYSEETNWQN